MFRNYLVTALRNLARNWLYGAISIAGLAVAFAAALLIAEFVRNEFSYDRWLPGYEKVYKLTDVLQSPGQPAMKPLAWPSPAPRSVTGPAIRASTNAASPGPIPTSSRCSPCRSSPAILTPPCSSPTRW